MEDKMSDFVRRSELQEVVDKMGQALNAFGELHSSMVKKFSAMTMLNAIITKVCMDRFNMSEDEILAAISSQTSDGEIVEFARQVLGAGPILRVIQGGKNDR